MVPPTPNGSAFRSSNDDDDYDDDDNDDDNDDDDDYDDDNDDDNYDDQLCELLQTRVLKNLYSIGLHLD
jgi:hypothetical protein